MKSRATYFLCRRTFLETDATFFWDLSSSSSRFSEVHNLWSGQAGTGKQLINTHHQHIFLRLRRLIFAVEIMLTIDELNNEILTLQNENDPYKKQLTKLLRKQSTEQLTAEQKGELADEIKSVRTTISENNQIIIQNKKQITARERQIAADKETNKNQITEKAKQITADKEKDAARERQIATDKETNMNQITAREKQITADKEKDAAIAKFRAERGETNSSPMLVIFFR